MSGDRERGKDEPADHNRRKFLKSLFGLGGAIEAAPRAVAAATAPARFFWADLNNGNIGFPTGLEVPSSRPGSVMKLVTAAAALEEGVLNANHEFECIGRFKVGRAVFRCPHEHGRLHIEKALSVSCNSFFAHLSTEMGAATVLEYGRLFGLATPISGFNARSYPASPSEPTCNYALGLSEELQPNALQLLRVAALIARDGAIPCLKSAELPLDEKERVSIELRPDTLKRLKNGMRLAVREGTAAGLDPEDRLKLAAKTGTVPHGKRFESWIVGYFPFEKPVHAFALFAPSGTSHESAVPEASQRLLSVEWPT